MCHSMETRREVLIYVLVSMFFFQNRKNIMREEINRERGKKVKAKVKIKKNRCKRNKEMVVILLAARNKETREGLIQTNILTKQ